MTQSNTEAHPAAASTARHKQLMLGLKLLVGMLVIAAPVLIASQFVDGVIGVAFYGVLASAFGWMAGGPRTGIIVVSALTVLGILVMSLSGVTWLLAIILILLGIGYGYGASRGIGSAVVQLPILTPYFMMDPPGLFQDPPVVGPTYFAGVAAVMMLTGLWTVLVLRFALPSFKPKPVEVPHGTTAILYGTVLGVIAAVIMIIGTSTDLKSHWVWVTLTLYVLADPNRLFSGTKMVGRVLGTLLGFTVVTLLGLTPLPDTVLQALALPALWLCLVFMLTHKPYWQYTLFLTISVVLMNSYGINTLLLDAERFGFTVLGAALSILAAFLVNLLHFRRPGLSAPQPAQQPSAQLDAQSAPQTETQQPEAPQPPPQAA